MENVEDIAKLFIGAKKLMCVESGGASFWTKGKIYKVENCKITDDIGVTWGIDSDCGFPVSGQFEKYEMFGMGNKTFTDAEMKELATAVAHEVIAILKDRL